MWHDKVVSRGGPGQSQKVFFCALSPAFEEARPRRTLKNSELCIWSPTLRPDPDRISLTSQGYLPLSPSTPCPLPSYLTLHLPLESSSWSPNGRVGSWLNAHDTCTHQAYPLGRPPGYTFGTGLLMQRNGVARCPLSSQAHCHLKGTLPCEQGLRAHKQMAPRESLTCRKALWRGA